MIFEISKEHFRKVKEDPKFFGLLFIGLVLLMVGLAMLFIDLLI